MATISEISQGSNYQGNAALGGYIPKAIDIDTKPLQTLAAYTVMRNKSLFDQRQKDADEMITELAELSKYDITNARGKDKEEAINSYNQLSKEFRDAAMKGTPNIPEEKTARFIDLKQKTNGIKRKINALNARGIAYNKRLNDIKTTYSDPKIREIKTKQLEDEFNSTDWQTPIGSEEKFEAILPIIGAASTRSSTANKTVGNQIVQQKLDIFVPSDNMNQSSVEALGFDRLSILPPNATEAEKRNFELQQASGGKAKILNEATALFNKALLDDKYKVNGVIDFKLIIQDNPMLAAFINGIDEYNAYADELTTDINNGVFKTKLGNEIPLGGVIELKDIFKIDKNKKLETKDLIFIEKFLSAPPKKEVEEKIIETNEAINKQNANTASRNAAVNERQLQFDRDKWDATQVGGETIKNGAWTFAESVYSDLTKLADKNGVISPDNIRKLNKEQLKYLGIESGTTVGIFNPLELKSGTAIQLVNGEIRVLNDATKLADGRYSGNFDNTKSTNVRNIATNRLNEELRNSGSKEVNTYMGIDVSGSNTSNTSGGSTSQLGGQSNVLSGSVDASKLVKGQSYTVNGKSYVWDGSKLKAQ